MPKMRPEVEYLEEEGFVRLNLRRPVNLYVPTDLGSYSPSKGKGKKPGAKLQLEWVHGYRGRDCRHNLLLLASGEVVYFSAAVAVVLQPEHSAQRHYNQHTDDIKCVAVHPEGQIVATGQVKGHEGILPHVRVWDSTSLETIQTLGEDVFNRGVVAVAFSKDGDLLGVVDDGSEQRLSIWRWADREKLAEVKAASDPVIGVTFVSSERAVTWGKNHISFWDISGNDLSRKTGLFGDRERPKYVTSVAVTSDGHVVSADSNGDLILWEDDGNTVNRVVSIGEDTALLFVGSFGDTIVAASKDGNIVVMDADLQPTGKQIQIPESYGSPRVVAKLGDDCCLIGTTQNALLHGNFEGNVELMTQGHRDEVWGVAWSPSNNHFVTAAHDGDVRCIDAKTHEEVWKQHFDMACQSVTQSPNGKVTVVGGSDGKWAAIENETQKVVHSGQDGDEHVQALHFSPDGSKLALASRDNFIYVFDFDAEENTFTKRGECQGHTSFVTHLDWSEDGSVIRTNSGDYEVLYWSADDCSHITQSENYRDLSWFSPTCVLAFDSLGIWEAGVDGTHVNGCHASKEKAILAAGDDDGGLKIYAYPARTHKAHHDRYGGHSSHVAGVRFSSDGSGLISVGGRDHTTLQWAVSED